jgi:hypothetical protein
MGPTDRIATDLDVSSCFAPAIVLVIRRLNTVQSVVQSLVFQPESNSMLKLSSLKVSESLCRSVVFLIVLAIMSIAVSAQSGVLESPTPVTANQISASIPALDIGDARFTRHFYILNGNPGDLTVSVESKDLNGDVDVFTAGAMRPLAKISIYASQGASSASKTIFLRQRELLILRVEARPPGDLTGTYRIVFGGGFEAMHRSASDNDSEAQSTTAGSSTRGTRRVSSVGALIEEPKPEPTPTPRVASTARENSKPEPESTPEAEKPPTTAKEKVEPTPAPVRRSTTRTNRGTRRPPPVRNSRSRPAAGSARTQPSPNSENPAAAKQDIPALPSSRLIIEMKDGTKTEHAMNTVRRVTIDNGQIVIFHNTGRIERVAMSNVARMAIEP